MLVWNAISSMLLTIFATSALEDSMDFIAAVISTMVEDPLCAAFWASLAMFLACNALLAVE